MKRMLLALIVLTLGMLLVSSCNDPSPLGAELIEGDQANIIHTDTITFLTSTVPEDSLVVYDPNPSTQLSNFFVGDYLDPVFGKVKANLVGQLWPNINPPNFEDAVFDSLVLLLRYDSTNTYGDLTSAPYNIRVHRLDENLNLERKYYSSETFQVKTTPLGETGDFYPKYSVADSLYIFDYPSPPKTDTVFQAAHLRIHLSQEFGEELLATPTEIYESSSAFLEQFNGIVVEGLNTTDGILSFNLLSSLSQMTLYYHTDTVFQQYKFLFSTSGAFFSTFDHDYENSDVKPFLNDPSKGDSLLFIQAMSGTNIKIEVPNIEKLGDIVVNKAEFKFTYADPEGGDMEIYPPVSTTIMAIEDNVEGGFAFTNDVILGLLSTSSNWFGGFAKETLDDNGNPITVYSYNASSHFQRMVDGSVENTIFIRAFPKQERARRSVLYGPKSSKYPVTFELTYTKLDP